MNRIEMSSRIAVNQHRFGNAKKTVTPEQKDFTLAAAKGDVKKMTELYRKYNKDKLNLDGPDNLGIPALVWAARQGYPTVAQVLLDWGARKDVTDGSGKTAADWARIMMPIKPGDYEGKYQDVLTVLQ